MKRHICAMLVCALLLESFAWAGLGSRKAAYVGGTVALKERTEGTPSTENSDDFEFKHDKGTLTIPYKKINSLDYGQKAGRRLGMAIAISPLLLFSKKRRHYLTIGFTDTEGRQQAAVFELGKDAIRPVLADLETRSGKKIEYEDDEARKSASGK